MKYWDAQTLEFMNPWMHELLELILESVQKEVVRSAHDAQPQEYGRAPNETSTLTSIVTLGRTNPTITANTGGGQEEVVRGVRRAPDA